MITQSVIAARDNYARLVDDRISTGELDHRHYCTRSLRRPRPPIIQMRPNLQAVQILPFHTVIEKTVSRPGVYVNDVLTLPEATGDLNG